MRVIAESLFGRAVRAAEPAFALNQYLNKQPFPQVKPGGRVIAIAVGKAAVPMMRAALAHLPDAEAIVVANYENHVEIPGVKVFAAGHPVPDANGETAALAVMAALERAQAGDQVIALISGGASALLPAPAKGLTLALKIRVNQLLLAGGFEITQMNLVRQQLSHLKGGGLVRLAAPAEVTAYVLSDVIGDDLRVIASGLTGAPIGTAQDAIDLMRSGGIWDDAPAQVQAHLIAKSQKADLPPTKATNILIGSNRQSLAAVLNGATDWNPVIVDDALAGDVADAAARIIAAAMAAPSDRPHCLIFGGETTVTLRGKGLGGRNQELALRVALSATGIARDWVFLSGGTDGRDGPTEPAGGVVDPGSLDRMRRAGVDPVALLADNASNAALAASGDLLITGATGTNVADVQILLLGTAGK